MRTTFFIIALSMASAALAADKRLEKLTPQHRKWIEEEVVYINTQQERNHFI
jgi:hypothetical protein